MYYCFYAIIGHEEKLPFYLIGLGINDCQCHIIRDQGYPYPQLYYCTRGEGKLLIQNQTYTIKPNTCFYIPAFCPHEYFPVGEIWEVHWLTFSGFSAVTTLAQLGLESAGVYKVSELSKLDNHFHEFIQIVESDKLYGNFYASAQIYQFLIEYHRTIHNISSIHSKDKNNIMSPIIAYIDAHFQEPLSLEDLCHVGNVSPQHLCRLFQKSLNVRPMAYIAKRRLQAAKSLLTLTTDSIQDIAMQVGFSDSNYFSTLFKRYENVTPVQYRHNRR